MAHPDRSSQLVQPGPGACCTPDFQCECGQRIWGRDPPALFSFCGFCLCSDPGAKEMLHCLRDVNLVALPVSGQALPKLSSDLSREKLNQETEITGSGRGLPCLLLQKPGRIMHWPSWAREKGKGWRAATLQNAVHEKDIKNKLFTGPISQQHLFPSSYLPLLETSYPITSKASSQTRQLHKGQTGGSHQDDSIWLQILPGVQSLPLCGGFLLNSTGRWLEAQWGEKTKNGEYVTGTICSWI